MDCFPGLGLFCYSTYPRKITIQVKEGMIKYVGGCDRMILQPMHTILGWKKPVDPFSFASGSQNVAQSNRNQTKMIPKFIEASQRG